MKFLYVSDILPMKLLDKEKKMVENQSSSDVQSRYFCHIGPTVLGKAEHIVHFDRREFYLGYASISKSAVVYSILTPWGAHCFW